MSEIRLKDTYFTITGTTAKDVSVVNLMGLVDALNELKRACPLEKFTLTQQIPQTDYRYFWKAKDGRTWLQTLRFDPKGVWQNFQVQDFFLEEEFTAHRGLRDRVRDFILAFQPTDLTVVFT